MYSVNNEAVPAEVDVTQSLMKPVVVLETLNLARWVALSENSVQWKMLDVFRVKLKLTFPPVVECHIPDIFSRLSHMPLAVVVIILCGDVSVVNAIWWREISNKNTQDTARCVNHLIFSAHDLNIYSIYISLSLCMFMYTENKCSGQSSSGPAAPMLLWC